MGGSPKWLTQVYGVVDNLDEFGVNVTARESQHLFHQGEMEVRLSARHSGAMYGPVVPIDDEADEAAQIMLIVTLDAMRGQAGRLCEALSREVVRLTDEYSAKDEWS